MGGVLLVLLLGGRAPQRTPRSAHVLGSHKPPLYVQDTHPEIVVITRLIPEADGTTCNERLEPISGCEYARILRVPFRDREG